MSARDIFNRGCELISRQVGYTVDDSTNGEGITVSNDKLINRRLLRNYTNLCYLLSSVYNSDIINGSQVAYILSSSDVAGATNDPHIIWVKSIDTNVCNRFYIKSLSTASNHFMRFTYIPNIDSIDIFLGTMDTFPE